MKILIALALLAVLAGALLVESIATCQFIIPDRVKRASEGMNRLLLLIPVLAVPVFAVLFLFVLKGRFYERLCHATLLLVFYIAAFFTTCANKTNVSESFNFPSWFYILGIVVSILVILVGAIYRLIW